jgi:hypothetical protein
MLPISRAFVCQRVAEPARRRAKAKAAVISTITVMIFGAIYRNMDCLQQSKTQVRQAASSRPHLAAVLQKGRKSAKIHISSGVIWGIPA